MMLRDMNAHHLVALNETTAVWLMNWNRQPETWKLILNGMDQVTVMVM
jgi:hypothetical protein